MRLALGEMLAEPQRVGDAALALLIGVVDVVETELGAVAQAGEGNRPPSCRR